MTSKFNRVLAVVNVRVYQNFIKLSAAVHELSSAQREKTEEYNIVIATAASNNKHPYVVQCKA